MVLRQTVMATHHSAQTSKTREAAALPKSAYGASRPLARVPAKVPSLNAPAVTQTWWCEPLLMPRCGRWCRSPPSRRGSAITTAASRSRPGQSAAGPARLFRCPHLSSPRRGGLVPHALSPGRQGSPEPLAPCGRSFRRRGPICERSSILSRSIDATSIGRTRSCRRLLTIVGFRDVRSPGLVFPVLCRDAETEVGAFHQRPAVRGQLGLRRRRSLQFQSSPQMGTGSV